MPIPVATAGADQEWAASTLPKTVTLAGGGSNSPDSYRWTMLSVPTGSNAATGTNGSFTGGVALVQNPTFVCDVVGGYVLQLEAHNGSGWSNPLLDKDGAQTAVYIQTEKLSLDLPGYQQYRYDGALNTDLTKLEATAPTATQNAALTGTSGTPGSGNKYVTDADSRNTNSRAPSGSASGDLGGTYPSPTVSQARGLRETAGPTTLAMGAVADGQYLKRVGSSIEGAAGGGGGSVPLTTKGDLCGYDTAVARIPVGADGKTLVADSSQALGLKWASQVAAGLVSDGTRKFEAATTSNQVISSEATPVAIPNEPLVITVTTAAGETVWVSFSLTAWASAGAQSSSYPRVYVDGAAVGVSQVNTIPNGTNVSTADAFPVTLSTAGSHTIELRMARYTANNTLYAGATLRVAQFQGGYIQPENVPILKYNSASTIDVAAAPGADSQLRCMLTDGQRYVSNVALSVNLTVSGRGGLDTGSEASSTWYYVYAVPATTSGQLAVVASVTAPGSGGPTGFTAWKYLGAIRNDGSSNIALFYQDANRFSYNRAIEPASSAALGTSAVSITSMSLSDVVPLTADGAFMFARIVSTGGDCDEYLYVAGESTNALLFCRSASNGGTGVYGQVRDYLPTPGSPKTCNYMSTGSTITTQKFFCTGWADGYLTQTVTQSQPMQFLTGSNGLGVTSDVTASDQTISASNTPAAIPNEPLSFSITTFAGEQVLLTYSVYWMTNSATATMYARLYVDGVAVGSLKTLTLGNSNSNGSLSDAFPEVFTAGPHTVELRVAKYSTDSNLTLRAGAQLRVAQFRGGYSNPDNMPILEYNTAAAINVRAAPGASGTLQVTLSDGIKYAAASPLSVNLTVSGRGGLDTGSEASSTWYYIYAVPPATVGGNLACVASVSPPSTGPTGFTAWKYLGAIRNDGSSDIIPFVQVGSRFCVPQSNTATSGWVEYEASKAADPSAVSVSLAAYIPVTASEVDLFAKSASQTDNIYFYVEGYTALQDQWTAYLPSNTGSELAWSMLVTQNRVVYRKSAGTATYYGFARRGWTDGYLHPVAPAVATPVAGILKAAYRVNLSTDVATSGGNNADPPSQDYAVIGNLSQSINVVTGDIVELSFTGTCVGTSSTVGVAGYVDGARTTPVQRETYGSAAWHNLSFSTIITGLTTGTKTIDIRAGKDGGTWTFYGATAQCGVCMTVKVFSGPTS